MDLQPQPSFGNTPPIYDHREKNETNETFYTVLAMPCINVDGYSFRIKKEVKENDLNSYRIWTAKLTYNPNKKPNKKLSIIFTGNGFNKKPRKVKGDLCSEEEISFLKEFAANINTKNKTTKEISKLEKLLKPYAPAKALKKQPVYAGFSL